MRRAMIRRDHPDLSLSRQCRLLSISRSSLFPPMSTPTNQSRSLEAERRLDRPLLAPGTAFHSSSDIVSPSRRFPRKGR